MTELFAASNPASYLYLLILLWLLFIKGLVLWWVIQALFKYRWVRWAVLGLVGLGFLSAVLAFVSVMLRIAFSPPQSAPQASAAAAPASPPEAEAPRPAQEGRKRAAIVVRVSADADVWIEGARCKRSGRLRRFQTPPLDAGEEYGYEIRARWLRGDDVMDEKRRIKVYAGGTTEVDFTRPEVVTSR